VGISSVIEMQTHVAARPSSVNPRNAAPCFAELDTPERAARMDAYADLVAAGLPTPGATGYDPPTGGDPSGYAECWCCGALTGKGPNWSGRKGWHVRDAGWLGTETYCPLCFKEWGWPDCPCAQS
jgi:hypothetical protein